MTSTIKRGFGKLGQRTGELLGHNSSNKSEVGDDFKDLQVETDNRHAGTEYTQAALLMYTNQLLKKKKASDNTKLELYLLENLGSAMIRLGGSLPNDSNYGRALESFGRTEEQLNDLQLKFVNSVKEGWLPELQRSLDDFKEYVAMQKKLESRRGEYDSKMVKFQKARKDNITIEDELRTAQVRYEDTYDDLGRRMMEMQDAEQGYLRGAFNFYEAQMDYHKKCYEELARLRGAFDECLQAKRAPAAERHPVGALLATRRSQQTLKPGEMTVPARHPIPFSGQGAATLGRSTSYRTAPGHFRNDSNQFSDRGDDTPDSGAATPRGYAAPQVPHLGRSNSDFVASPGERQPAPAVATRRHAPPPPMPARNPRRVLMRANYKFRANELGELELEKGDIVELIKRIDDGGWGQGKLVYAATGLRGMQVGQTGLFPINYMEECKESDIPPATPTRELRSAAISHQRSESFQSAGYKPPVSARTLTNPAQELKLKPTVTEDCKHCGCSDHKSNPLDHFRCTNCFHYHS
ncbi:BAR-domain-containing protein [Coemansia reversa NRRL 1564]|uniref:BAR-domain-containing protein n=1 Tax=Coemansia reversa (strain ATCC 12441 / NRRL 1564) TaxID=763665 RepID=A0A2G5BAS4_COERN|nr:BAR-domain-containing protein [Coemansia reversa NRRL 1564]|eukprot:PIA16115.1 BAR-domain-containing protein [Coemansia reversa NRRL 1564]